MKAVKNTLTTLSLLLAIAVAANSCDFIRSTLGKPTSSDIAAMRTRKAAFERAVADSLARVEAEAARLAAVKAIEDSIANARYFVVLGAFKDTVNCTKLSSKLEQLGYGTTRIDLKNGLTAVAVPGSDHLSDPALRQFSPWLLDTEKNK